MTAPDTPAAAVLAGIRKRHMAFVNLGGARGIRSGLAGAAIRSAADVPFLLAAVKAALKPHQPGRIVVHGSLCKRHANHRHFSITSTEADDVRACPDCSATVYTSCTGCGPQVSVDTCPVREAITAALTGTQQEEGGSDG